MKVRYDAYTSVTLTWRLLGLIHVSKMASRGSRINHPSEVVERNARVKVKVLSIIGNRISLSMKDVDQRTGEDLTPHLNPDMAHASSDGAERGRPTSLTSGT